MEVSVSFLKEGNYKQYLKEINNTKADYIHFDVMDGKFVKNKNLPLKELLELIFLSNKSKKFKRKKYWCRKIYTKWSRNKRKKDIITR